MVSSKLCAQSKFIVQGIGRFTHRFTASRLLYRRATWSQSVNLNIAKNKDHQVDHNQKHYLVIDIPPIPLPSKSKPSITKILYCSFVVLYFKIYCVKFQVSNLNFIFLQLFWVAILVDWGELSKHHLIAFCPHIDCVSMQNLEFAALMVSEKRCLDMTHKRFFTSR